MKIKVTVYITCHNYADYIKEAIESVYKQTFQDWELIIIDDGSIDNSKELIKKLVDEDNKKIRCIFNDKSMGLPYCANLAIDMAEGEYMIRLDADDYFDQSALLSMSAYLDIHQELALVFPNYIYIDREGKYLGVEQRKIIGDESMLLDLPAHGACTMVRKRILKIVGGYSTDYKAQDGYEMWLHISRMYKVGNISTPLFFYRQHSDSLSTNEGLLLDARKKIKRSMAKDYSGKVKPRIAAIIPAKNTYKNIKNVCLEKVAGKALIDYTLDEAADIEMFDKILVTSDDKKVLDYCKKKNSNIYTHLRSTELSFSRTKHLEIIKNAVEFLKNSKGFDPDILVMLNIHTPLRKAKDINEALDTLFIFNVDSVTSVYEDYDLHFVHGKYGIEPLNKGALNLLRLEREALYVDNGAIKVFWKDVLAGTNLYGNKYGHIVMQRNRSVVYDDELSKMSIEAFLSKEDS